MPIGGYTARVTFGQGRHPQWEWSREEGTTQTSVPAAVRQEHAGELKELKRSVAEVEKVLAAQRDRLERLLPGDRCWRFGTWRARYLGHPLIAPLARLLGELDERSDESGGGVKGEPP